MKFADFILTINEIMQFCSLSALLDFFFPPRPVHLGAAESLSLQHIYWNANNQQTCSFLWNSIFLKMIHKTAHAHVNSYANVCMHAIMRMHTPTHTNPEKIFLSQNTSDHGKAKPTAGLLNSQWQMGAGRVKNISRKSTHLSLGKNIQTNDHILSTTHLHNI